MDESLSIETALEAYKTGTSSVKQVPQLMDALKQIRDPSEYVRALSPLQLDGRVAIVYAYQQGSGQNISGCHLGLLWDPKKKELIFDWSDTKRRPHWA